jgi:tetratricopeptide (TPR) repeat protein
MSARLQQILTMLEKSPGDAFLCYAAALEHKKSGDFARAIDFLTRTIQCDDGYCYAYYQLGQCHEESGNTDAAIDAYQLGVAAARRVGDGKALGEIGQALDLLT